MDYDNTSASLRPEGSTYELFALDKTSNLSHGSTKEQKNINSFFGNYYVMAVLLRGEERRQNKEVSTVTFLSS